VNATIILTLAESSTVMIVLDMILFSSRGSAQGTPDAFVILAVSMVGQACKVRNLCNRIGNRTFDDQFTLTFTGCFHRRCPKGFHSGSDHLDKCQIHIRNLVEYKFNLFFRALQCLEHCIPESATVRDCCAP
jgi:hypothetical protein